MIGSLVVAGVEDELRREVLGGPAHREGLGVNLRLTVYHDRERDFLGETEVDQPRVPFPVHHDVLRLSPCRAWKKKVRYKDEVDVVF